MKKKHFRAYISPDDRTLPPGTIFLAFATGPPSSEVRLMETETAGRLRLTGNGCFDWPLLIGSSDTLAGKIPAKTLLGILLPEELAPADGRGRCCCWKGERFCDEGVDAEAGRCWGASAGPTGGCILLLTTTYFWSLDAENERVVPFLTWRNYRLYIFIRGRIQHGDCLK